MGKRVVVGAHSQREKSSGLSIFGISAKRDLSILSACQPACDLVSSLHPSPAPALFVSRARTPTPPSPP